MQVLVGGGGGATGAMGAMGGQGGHKGWIAVCLRADRRSATLALQGGSDIIDYEFEEEVDSLGWLGEGVLAMLSAGRMFVYQIAQKGLRLKLQTDRLGLAKITDEVSIALGRDWASPAVFYDRKRRVLGVIRSNSSVSELLAFEKTLDSQKDDFFLGQSLGYTTVTDVWSFGASDPDQKLLVIRKEMPSTACFVLVVYAANFGKMELRFETQWGVWHVDDHVIPCGRKQIAVMKFRDNGDDVGTTLTLFRAGSEGPVQTIRVGEAQLIPVLGHFGPISRDSRVVALRQDLIDIKMLSIDGNGVIKEQKCALNHLRAGGQVILISDSPFTVLYRDKKDICCVVQTQEGVQEYSLINLALDASRKLDMEGLKISLDPSIAFDSVCVHLDAMNQDMEHLYIDYEDIQIQELNRYLRLTSTMFNWDRSGSCITLRNEALDFSFKVTFSWRGDRVSLHADNQQYLADIDLPVCLQETLGPNFNPNLLAVVGDHLVLVSGNTLACVGTKCQSVCCFRSLPDKILRIHVLQNCLFIRTLGGCFAAFVPHEGLVTVHPVSLPALKCVLGVESCISGQGHFVAEDTWGRYWVSENLDSLNGKTGPKFQQIFTQELPNSSNLQSLDGKAIVFARNRPHPAFSSFEVEAPDGQMSGQGQIQWTPISFPASLPLELSSQKVLSAGLFRTISSPKTSLKIIENNANVFRVSRSPTTQTFPIFIASLTLPKDSEPAASDSPNFDVYFLTKGLMFMRDKPTASATQWCPFD